MTIEEFILELTEKTKEIGTFTFRDISTPQIKGILISRIDHMGNWIRLEVIEKGELDMDKIISSIKDNFKRVLK